MIGISYTNKGEHEHSELTDAEPEDREFDGESPPGKNH